LIRRALLAGGSLRALKASPGATGSAKPVAVERGYVFDVEHPFKRHFDSVAPSGEIDGEAFSSLLKECGLVDGRDLPSSTSELNLSRTCLWNPESIQRIPRKGLKVS
jgi:hypothetical protein